MKTMIKLGQFITFLPLYWYEFLDNTFGNRHNLIMFLTIVGLLGFAITGWIL